MSESFFSSRKRRRFAAFTLIELLVVIAIIAMLISILLPSLEAARRASKKATCLAHIKNIGTSSRVYEADDPQGWGIPVHPLQYDQTQGSQTFVGAYEWGGKSGIGRPDEYPNNFGAVGDLSSKYGTAIGFGPSTRPMNNILYPAGFKDNTQPYFNRIGGREDTNLDLALFKCPGDDGPPRGAHCADWIKRSEVSSYDFFGNSYAANIFMTAAGDGMMYSNSPYMRPTTRVPTPSRTLYYEENIGRWAWSCKNEIEDCTWVGAVDPGPTKTVRGWHGKDWTFNRVFVDAHAESQRIWIEGTEDSQGYAEHYRNEVVFPDDPTRQSNYNCIIVRGPGWQKDTLPASRVPTYLNASGDGRPSYEDCVESE